MRGISRLHYFRHQVVLLHIINLNYSLSVCVCLSIFLSFVGYVRGCQLNFLQVWNYWITATKKTEYRFIFQTLAHNKDNFVINRIWDEWQCCFAPGSQVNPCCWWFVKMAFGGAAFGNPGDGLSLGNLWKSLHCVACLFL